MREDRRYLLATAILFALCGVVFYHVGVRVQRDRTVVECQSIARADGKTDFAVPFAPRPSFGQPAVLRYDVCYAMDSGQ